MNAWDTSSEHCNDMGSYTVLIKVITISNKNDFFVALIQRILCFSGNVIYKL